MPDRLFKHHDLLACDSCGEQWFGKAGEAQARRHAQSTGHQVRIEYCVRETLNEVSEAHQAAPAAQVSLSQADLRRSRERAVTRARRTGFGP